MKNDNPTYPLPSILPVGIDPFKVSFLKEIVVTEGASKQGILEFEHRGKKFRLAADFLDNLIGDTVLVDAGFTVFLGGVNLGHATRA